MSMKSMKNIIIPSLLALSAAIALPACSKKDGQNGHVSDQSTKPELGSFGIALDLMDTSVKPGDNFFQYVNGGWLNTTEIPEDKDNYGSFSLLHDRSVSQVKAIIQDMAAATSKPGSNEQKIGDLYGAFMDTDMIEKNGLAPARADLDAFKAASDHKAVAALMGNPALPVRAPLGGWVDVDAKDVGNYIFYITQAGLGMPAKANYLDTDEKSATLRADYLVFLTGMLNAAGEDNAQERAAAVMAYETAMADVHWKPEKARNRDLTYNKMTMDELTAYAPGFNWQAFMDGAGLGKQTVFIIQENDAMQGLAKVFGQTPVGVLQDYMIIHYLSGNSGYLPESIDDINFAFYSTAVRGTEVKRARWKRGVGAVSRVLGEAIGQVYVQRHFSKDAKIQMDGLVENLRATFKDGINELEWMSPETQAEAQDKLAKFYPKIGYPKNWTSYSELKIDRNNLVSSMASARTWEWDQMVSKLGGPIDREEWFMTPQTVNAYYNPGFNEIVFPAAILQAPFFDPNADAAVNYGGIGAVIGHEMGHGFDDQGAKSDGNGEQRNWWTPADEAAFKERTDVLVTQFGQFEALPDLFVNGEFTLGENIGDLTGLTMAYAAYHRSLGGKPAPMIDGLSGDQRFFLSYAQIWQRKYRDKALRSRIKTDPHSPGEFRANGIVRNFGPWYDAFDVQPGDALYLPPEERVKIW